MYGREMSSVMSHEHFSLILYLIQSLLLCLGNFTIVVCNETSLLVSFIYFLVCVTSNHHAVCVNR